MERDTRKQGHLSTPTTRRLGILVLAVAVLAAWAVWRLSARGARAAAAEVVTARIGTLEAFTRYTGTLEARRAHPISSHLAQSSTIIDVAPEGTLVEPGDSVVRFDPAGIERDVIRLEREARLARAQLASLEHGEIPLKIGELDAQLAEARAARDEARVVLDDTRELRAEDLVAEQEVVEQQRRVAQAEQHAASVEQALELTRSQLHPAALERARAAVDGAERELALIREERAQCEVSAPAAGVVIYKPLHVGGEYRTARVGDTVYRNQPFLLVADMSDLVVRCTIPESELAQVPAGAPAEVTAQAFPEVRLPAVVESIGAMAQSVAGLPAWQKYFLVTLRLDATDARLRSGMTVDARIQSVRLEDALLLPRRAVAWGPGGPCCRVAGRGASSREVPVVLGAANDTDVQVRDGLQPGARVVVP